MRVLLSAHICICCGGGHSPYHFACYVLSTLATYDACSAQCACITESSRLISDYGGEHDNIEHRCRNKRQYTQRAGDLRAYANEEKCVFQILYGILFILGILGNLFVMLMICHIFVTQCGRTIQLVRTSGALNSSYHVIIYVLALSIVDFLVCAQLPIVIINLRSDRGWPLGEVMCKVKAHRILSNEKSTFLQMFMVTENLPKILSTYMLTLMAWDRYMVVCQPIASMRCDVYCERKSNKCLRYRYPWVAMAILGCVLIWCLCVISPMAFIAQRFLVEEYKVKERTFTVYQCSLKIEVCSNAI